MCVLPAVEEENPEFWRSRAQESLQSVLDRRLNYNVAKNVILFLGDGRLHNSVIFSHLDKTVWLKREAESGISVWPALSKLNGGAFVLVSWVLQSCIAQKNYFRGNKEKFYSIQTLQKKTFKSPSGSECLGFGDEQEMFVCVVCNRHGIDNLHSSSYLKGTAAEPDWRRDCDDYGHLPLCGTS